MSAADSPAPRRRAGRERRGSMPGVIALAVAIAIKMEESSWRLPIAMGCIAIACFFVWRSFYGMRIPVDAKKA